MKTCCKCGVEIPQIRLEAIPDTNCCVKCSVAPKYVGFMDWYHKTAPELVMVSSNDKENLRRAQRVSDRSR